MQSFLSPDELSSAPEYTEPRQGLSLTTRLVLAAVLVIGSLITMMLSANHYFVAEHLKNLYLDKATAIAAALDREISSPGDLADSRILLDRLRDNLLLNPELQSIAIFKPQGEGFISLVSSRAESPAPSAHLEHFEAFRADRVITREMEMASGRLLCVFTPLHIDGKPAGTMQFDLSLQHLDRLQQQLLGNIFMGFLPFIFLFALLLYLYIRRRIVAPVVTLGEVARELARGSYRTRLEVTRDDELGSLYGEFNQMASSLEQQRQEMLDAKHHFMHLALHDPLTGLPNRSLLVQQFPQYLAGCKRHGRRGALLLIDLDRFKCVNDNFGHIAGDELLRMIAQRLERILRREDFLARIGGDEFVVILTEVSSDADEALYQIQSAVDSLLRNMAAPMRIEGNEVRATASIGVVFFPGRENELDDIMRNADSVMYKAKQKDGNRACFFDQDMQQLQACSASVLGTLQQAIDGNQLQVFYQPQVDRRGSVIGAEALVRWLHPQRGLILPRDFLKAIENNRLMLEVGSWVLHKVCSQYPALRKRYGGGPDFSVAVNISASQFNQVDFVEATVAVLEQNRLPPGALVLEITEEVLLQNKADSRQRIEAIKKAGLRVSIDDYGTGCSSLTCLRDLAPDEIKLDSELLRNLSASERDREIVCAIIDISRTLNLNLIAEGVETREQFEFLKSHNCEIYQGRHFQEPLPLNRLDS